MIALSRKFGSCVLSFLAVGNELYHEFYTQDGDETSVYDSSQALYTLQKLYGLFPRIVGKGDSASVSRSPLLTGCGDLLSPTALNHTVDTPSTVFS
jgi:hypothetical protein